MNGIVESDDLTFLTGAGLTGEFSKLVFEFPERTSLVIDPSFNLQTGTGGKVDASNNGTPLVLEGGSYPRGTIKVTLPFNAFHAGAPFAVGIRDGRLDCAIKTSGDGAFMIEDGLLRGSTTFAGGPLVVDADLELAGLRAVRTAAGSFSIRGTVAGEIKPGAEMSITSDPYPPYEPGRGYTDPQVFEIITGFNLPTGVQFGPIAWRMEDGVLNVDTFEARIAIVAEVPHGLGEHQADGIADGHHGPDDETKHLQEVWTDKRGLRIHIYICPASRATGTAYHFTVGLKFGVKNNDIFVDVSQVSLAANESIRWKKDGGDLGILGTIIGALLGAITFGPLGELAGGIVGKVAADNLDDAINKLVASTIAKKLLELRLGWHSRI